MPKNHSVTGGDLLWKISVKYYGTPDKWPDIVKANPQLQERGSASDGSPFIYPGDTLIIPDLLEPKESKAPVKASQTVVLDESAKRDLALFCDGKKFTGFTGYTVVCSVDTFDAFSFSTVWDTTKKELRDLFRPFTYKECEVYFDGDLIFKGRLLPAVPSVSPDSKTITVQGYPLCAVLNDSTLPPTLYPPEYNGLNLKQIAENIAGVFSVQVQTKADVGANFISVEIAPEDKILDFLKKLAEQRGVLLSNTQDGSLLIWKPEQEKVSATFKEGELPFISCVPAFDGQKMFSHVTGFTKVTEENNSQKYTFKNNYLIKHGVLRCYAQVMQDVEPDGLENAVKAMACRMFASAVKYTLTVAGHRDKNGKLYRKNMMVSVLAPDAEIYQETKLQVDEVQLKRSESEGEQTVFTLVMPGSRTGEDIERFAWEE